jgi:Fic family protein
MQERNLIRQYDLLISFIQIGNLQGPNALDKYALWALNHVAVAGIAEHGGRFRRQPVYVGRHIPPPYWDVEGLMDEFISWINVKWYRTTPTILAAYGLWRLNFIHPFVEGNGRTARAVCYYLLCVKFDTLLPGKKILPERIRESRDRYYDALRDADNAWGAGHLDLTSLEAYLAELLRDQLSEAVTSP